MLRVVTAAHGTLKFGVEPVALICHCQGTGTEQILRWKRRKEDDEK